MAKRHHQHARHVRYPGTRAVSEVPQKFFARDRRSRVKLRDASDGAAHRKIKIKKGRAVA